jgi:hypothetical protein
MGAPDPGAFDPEAKTGRGGAALIRVKYRVAPAAGRCR